MFGGKRKKNAEVTRPARFQWRGHCTEAKHASGTASTAIREDALQMKVSSTQNLLQATTGLVDTVLADTTGLTDKLSKKHHFRGERKLVLFPGFADMTALEDQKSMTVFFSTKPVVDCTFDPHETLVNRN